MSSINEEILAVVNERDQVIGERPRSEVHRLRLRHRAVHIVVCNDHGEVLLQKRSMAKDCCPELWDSAAAGHVDRNEDYDDCARRELDEELGLGADLPLERLFKINACEDTGWEFCWVYLCRAEGPFAFNPEEIDTVAWFTPSRLTRELQDEPCKFSGTVPLIWPRVQAWLARSSRLTNGSIDGAPKHV